ncbi:hypothetical protein JG687_00002481 [Phytophthora cactorum]|uniref:Alpha,alpha-trehalose-phosphate synthase [UDP-forming] 9 n=1 Tax=Phytophthora cactorum TaxID=29920 RepID=A0A8T1UUC7_9STRA|nr:hypothetical protein JG687_00002481 [Phytophthora cactorum]
MAPPDGWTPETPVIIAANRLPVRLSRTSDGQWRVEWAGDRMIESQNSLSHYEISERATIKFVGRVADVDVPFEERQQVELLLRELNCFPVFLESQEAKLYYEDYCKQTLWPTFHNVVDVYSPVDVVLDVQAQQHLTPSAQFWNPNWQKVAWQAYANVNQLYAHKICELYEQGDVVWVQDYHLLLTPSYIVRKLRAANVGLFLHVPFPSSEVFRTLSMRKELLRGMLNADHIGFHLFEYARHFMSACRRILGLSYEPILRGQLGIDYGGRRVAVTCSHMAIDVQRVEETLVSGDVRDMVVALRQRYRDKKIFAGCDTIERLKGIPSKMLAFDGFLSRCPDFIGKAVLVQKGIHRRGRVTDYLQSKKEIELAVQTINNKYREVAKGNVVDYEEVDEFPYKERVALWRVADVQITTFVAANPPRRWAKCVLTDIVNARKKEESFVYMGTGFGLDFRLMEVSAQFRKLTGQELAPAYRTSTNRAIFLDYYRTLAPDVSKLMGVRWPDVPLSALSTLEQLCKDPRNTVFIVSGCNCDLLTQKFGGVPGLGLVAEHGYFIRRAVLGNDARIGRPWERHGDILQSDGGHQQWRVKAEKIIQLYVDRTNGSTLELRRSAVLFRYGKSDFDFGTLQAAELKEHLEGVFEGWPLNIIQGKDYIEVRPEGVGKGKLIGHLLNKMRVDGNPADFVLCIGDDVADELMFEQLKTMVAHQELPKDKVFTCTVGQKPSKAEFFVDDYTDVIALLKSLKVVATKSNRNYSLSDMQSFVRDTRPFLASSSHGTSGVPRSATSDTVIRKSSSRHALYKHLTPVIEDQIVSMDGGGGVRSPSPNHRRNKWLNRLQQLGAVAILVGILRWRSGVKNPHEKKLLMYLVASLGIAWSIQRVRSKSHK